MLVLALTALASWMMASSLSDSGPSGFSDFAALALSLHLSFCCRPLSGLDWQAFARCPVCLQLLHFRLSLLSVHSPDLCPLLPHTSVSYTHLTLPTKA